MPAYVLSKNLRCLIAAFALLIISGCGDSVFEKVMFSPAGHLPQDEDPCDHFPAGYSCELTDFSEIFFASLDNQTRLHGLFFRNPQSQKLIIYFHGNGSNIYFRIRYAVKLVEIASVLILSYRGYGKSSGRPSEKGLYEDAAATISYARDMLQFEEENIYLYGRSLGGAVAIEAAQSQHLAGLILVSTFSSGYDLASDRGLENWPGLGRPFDSINKLNNLQVPIIFIHGNRDGLVPIAHSKRLYEAYTGAEKYFFEIDNVSHWGISSGDDFWNTISLFINGAENDDYATSEAPRETATTPANIESLQRPQEQ